MCRGLAAYHDYCVFPLRGDMTANSHCTKFRCSAIAAILMNLSSAQRDQHAHRLLMPQQEAHLVKWTLQQRNASRSRCAQPFWRRSDKCQVSCQTLERCTRHDTQHEEIGSPLLEAQSYECSGPEKRRSSVAHAVSKLLQPTKLPLKASSLNKFTC